MMLGGWVGWLAIGLVSFSAGFFYVYTYEVNA